MQGIKDYLRENTLSSFKDARLTLEASLESPALGAELAQAAAYAVALSLKASGLASVLKQNLTTDRIEQAEVATAIMGMTNVYYSFLHLGNVPDVASLPAQLRMVSYGQQTAKDKFGFEALALAVSIAGKCQPCITSHVAALKELGITSEQLRDLARIAASVHAVAKSA